MRLLSCITLALGVGFASAAEYRTQTDDGFKPLFNGKDLSGWIPKGAKGEPLEGKTEAFGGRFKVADGVITIDPKVKGDVRIMTVKEFAKDATIRLDYKPAEDCNNDLFFRGQKYDLSKANVKNIKFGDWNTIEIAVIGDKVEIKSNGETVKTAVTKVEKSPLEIRAEFGSVQIKNIRVKSAE